MGEFGWRVHRVSAELPTPSSLPTSLVERPTDWEAWLADSDIPVGTPFLISPTFEYDVALNAFFSSVEMVASPRTTQEGYARDVAAFLTFLWTSRGEKSWRDASEADHTAYLIWRRRDPAGPMISDTTWDREVAAVNRFYRWQLRAGNIRHNPIPQRERRPIRGERGWAGGWGAESPATYSHGATRERISWLPRRHTGAGATSECAATHRPGFSTPGFVAAGQDATRRSAT